MIRIGRRPSTLRDGNRGAAANGRGYFSPNFVDWLHGNADEVRVSDVMLDKSQFLANVPEISTLFMLVLAGLGLAATAAEQSKKEYIG